jgi:ABC-type sugar transport system permease subunit
MMQLLKNKGVEKILVNKNLESPTPLQDRPLDLKRAEKSRFSPGSFVERHIAYFLIAPTILGIAVVNIYPLLDTVRLSFTNRLLSRPEDETKFIGLDNYSNILTNPGVWNAFKVSLIFTGVSVFVSFVIGFGLALLLNRPLPGRGILRSIFIIPWAVPAFVAALTWSWMFNEQFGIFASLLKGFGVSRPPIWLGADLALFSLTVVMIWKSFPFQLIVLMAGLQAIPGDLYEAAEVDGAVSYQKFRFITMPLIKPVAMISVLLAAINAFNFFTIPWILTRGGPGETTAVLPIYTYTIGFVGGDFGFAATMAVIMFIFILLAGSLYLWQYLREVDASGTQGI